MSNGRRLNRRAIVFGDAQHAPIVIRAAKRVGEVEQVMTRTIADGDAQRGGLQPRVVSLGRHDIVVVKLDIRRAMRPVAGRSHVRLVLAIQRARHAGGPVSTIIGGCQHPPRGVRFADQILRHIVLIAEVIGVPGRNLACGRYMSHQ